MLTSLGSVKRTWPCFAVCTLQTVVTKQLWTVTAVSFLRDLSGTLWKGVGLIVETLQWTLQLQDENNIWQTA